MANGQFYFTKQDKLNMKAPSYPTIRLFMNGKHIEDHQGSREPNDIRDFIRKHMKSNIKGSKKKIKKSKKKKCKTYKLKKKESYKMKDYKGKNHDDPKWIEKTFGIVGGGKSKKNKCKCNKRCNSKCIKKKCKCNN